MNDKKKYYHIIPPVITVLVMLIVYIIKGVYPFGSGDIAYYDMNAQYIPNYARNYYILHGQDSLVFDWLAGSGMDMVGALPQYTLHPVNWILFFINPDHVLQFMALFLVIKLVITSLSMSVYLRKTYDLDLVMHVTLCMIFTFSGYLVGQYVNLFFLDSMMMFPLLLLAARYMMEKGKGLPYLALMTLQLISSWYLGYMTLFFLLFYSFGFIHILPDNEKRKTTAARVGIYTVLSLIISVVIIMPSIVKTASSSRFAEYNPALYLVFGTPGIDPQDLDQKLFTAFNSELAAALCLILIFRRIVKKELFTPELAFRLFVLLFTAVPLINESTHLIWHMGSYGRFPYRCGYILVFSFIDFIAYMWKYEDEKPRYMLKNKKALLALPIGVSVILALALLVKMSSSFISQGIYKGYGSYKYAFIIYVLFTLVYLALIIFAHKKTREAVFCFSSIVSAGIIMVCFVAPTNDPPAFHYLITEKPFHQTIKIKNNIQFNGDYLSKVKMQEPVLTRNYSQLLGTPSINQWLTDATPEYLKSIVSLGYGANYVCNYDWGGTIFSDALLNIKKTVAYRDAYVPEQLYSKYAEIEDFSVYDMKYTLPFGILDDERWLSLDTDEKVWETKSTVEASNNETSDSDKTLTEQEEINNVKFKRQIQIANTLYEEAPLLYEIPSDEASYVDPINPEYKYGFEYNVHLEKPSVLYVSLAKYSYATVNGKEIKRPFFAEEEESSAEDEGIGIMLAGVYDAGTDITINVCNQSGVTTNDHFALLDLDVMQKICDKYSDSCASSYKAGKNRLDMTADVNGRNYMFLPLEYLEGWTAEVNGEKAEIYPVMNGAFMALKLPDGHCDIVMKYMNPYIRKGAVISLIGLAAAAVVLILKKKGKDIAEIPAVAGTAYVLLNVAAIGMLLFMYVLPLLI